jgi:hypothetical protein
MHSSPGDIRVIKSKSMRWTGHVTRIREIRHAYKISIEKCEGKRPLGKLSCKWKYSIKMDIK